MAKVYLEHRDHIRIVLGMGEVNIPDDSLLGDEIIDAVVLDRLMNANLPLNARLEVRHGFIYNLGGCGRLRRSRGPNSDRFSRDNRLDRGMAAVMPGVDIRSQRKSRQYNASKSRHGRWCYADIDAGNENLQAWN